MSSFPLLWVLLLLWVWSEAIANANNDYEIEGSNIECPILNSKIVVNIGAIIDLSSRVGKEQKTAMEVAMEDVNRQSCYKLALNFNNNTHGNPSPTILAAGNVQFLHFIVFPSLWHDYSSYLQITTLSLYKKNVEFLIIQL